MSGADGYIEIRGKISSVVYTNEENGYTVLRLDTGDGGLTTVVGTLPSAAPGEELHAYGDWVKHPSHGRQFKAELAERSLPKSADAIYEYLAGHAVQGIGPATAAVIVDRFGDKSLDVIENNPELLAEIKGISKKKAEQMTASFRRQTGLRRLMEFLCAHELRPILAVRLYKFHGEESLDIVGENPYIIAAPHIGGSFAEADRLAIELGMEDDSPHRVCAAVSFELRHNAGNGHCFIPLDKLIAATAQFISVTTESVEEALSVLDDEGTISQCRVVGRDAVYLSSIYEAEEFTAKKLKELASIKITSDLDTQPLIVHIEKQSGMSYAPLQRETISLAAESSVMALTGGPGTGKTTTVRAILAMYDALGIEALLTAPTGRAAKRMSELTGREASTIHRLLGSTFAPDNEEVIFTKDETDPLECGAVILDESSMVDITLIRALLEAMPPECRLIMVGDADQLPSVGPGNVFSDILRSGVVPAVRLTEIFRQSEGSRIVRNAHMINRGEHPRLTENSGDFFFLKRPTAEKTAETVAELCSQRLPKNMGVPTEDIQVLTPTRRGEAGTFSLNKRLQLVLNPADKGKNEKIFGDITFREGDRVMQIRNNYDIIWHRHAIGQEVESQIGESGNGIYNGDIGYILGIDAETETMMVDFDGRAAVYGFDQLLELEHAWAMTVHKSQGSEYRAVVLAASQGAPQLMTRGVLYTAVTRAKQLLIAVGEEAIANSMIDNHKQSRRYSGLRARLCDEVGDYDKAREHNT